MNELLQPELDAIVSYCNDARIPVFFGSFEQQNLVVVDWDSGYQQSWKLFLESLFSSDKSTPLIIDIDVYKQEEFVNADDIESQSDELKTQIKEVVTNLSKYENQIYSLDISVIKYSSCYRFSLETFWCRELDLLMELVDQMEEFSDEEEEEEVGIKIKDLSKEELKGYVDKLLKDEDFTILSLAHQRKDHALELLRDELNYVNIIEVISKAERELEKYFRSRVKALKDLGKKKTEIAAELNMSKDRVNKYYY